eukprot:15464993-Alexandrium_andersonii.AAC.1
MAWGQPLDPRLGPKTPPSSWSWLWAALACLSAGCCSGRLTRAQTEISISDSLITPPCTK